MADIVLHPQILWAQRKDTLLITVTVDDFKVSNLTCTENKLHIEGKGGPEQKSYKAELDFYDLVEENEPKTRISSREIFIVVQKKTPGPYWPRMTKTKLPYLKTDFNKWKDEDESDEEDGPMGGMGGMPGGMGGMPGGMGGMPGGMGGMPGGMGGNLEEMMAQMGGGGAAFPGLDDLNQGSDDSDDEQLPDLEDDTVETKS
ncbi:prostaglandin E synthase 3-like [Antedon mediterranea]|uniref:prostaglandin E synthase 3-like n=1 Tax=Antedon mediterranea TaxID=105859 RepID=UPI003AF5DC1E